MEKKINQKNRAKRRRIAKLIGIPVLLFVSGITLLSWLFLIMSPTLFTYHGCFSHKKSLSLRRI